ncbi:MAG: hypothetical protein PHU12_01440 [Candidatus Aenigmarchaeota archaeon]|nr:hypothetical protein [Candidatus Aenigmarchaeota archaeon]
MSLSCPKHSGVSFIDYRSFLFPDAAKQLACSGCVIDDLMTLTQKDEKEYREQIRQTRGYLNEMNKHYKKRLKTIGSDSSEIEIWDYTQCEKAVMGTVKYLERLERELNDFLEERKLKIEMWKRGDGETKYISSEGTFYYKCPTDGWVNGIKYPPNSELLTMGKKRIEGHHINTIVTGNGTSGHVRKVNCGKCKKEISSSTEFLTHGL